MPLRVYPLLLLMFVHTAMAESYSFGSITGLTIGSGYARVKTNAMTNAEGCSTQSWYVLPLDSDLAKEMYVTLLAAKLAGQLVQVQLSGCQINYPKVTHVYVCDNSQCS